MPRVVRIRAGSATNGPGRGFRRRLLAGARTRASEAGFSIVEICITVAIMGLAFTALLGSMATATSTSDLMARRAQADSYGRQLTELLRGGEVKLVQCDPDLTIAEAYESALASVDPLDRFTFKVVDARATSDVTETNLDDWDLDCWTTRPLLEWVQIEVTAAGTTPVSVKVAVLLRHGESA